MPLKTVEVPLVNCTPLPDLAQREPRADSAIRCIQPLEDILTPLPRTRSRSSGRSHPRCGTELAVSDSPERRRMAGEEGLNPVSDSAWRSLKSKTARSFTAESTPGSGRPPWRERGPASRARCPLRLRLSTRGATRCSWYRAHASVFMAKPRFHSFRHLPIHEPVSKCSYRNGAVARTQSVWRARRGDSSCLARASGHGQDENLHDRASRIFKSG